MSSLNEIKAVKEILSENNWFACITKPENFKPINKKKYTTDDSLSLNTQVHFRIIIWI